MDAALIQSFQQRLAAEYAASRKRRAEAFVAYTPVVAGVALRPITLDTYNLLVAWGNPFVVGGPLSFDALFQFIWAHHPHFGQFAHRERRAALRRVLRALEPRHPILSSLAGLLCPILSGLPPPVSRLRSLFRSPFSLLLQILRRFLEPNAAELLASAFAECTRLVQEAIGDFPSDRRAPDAKSGALAEPLPFAMQAQVLGLMRREFGVSFDTARSMPLKELSQHLREAVWVTSRGKAVLMTEAESAIWHEHELAREAAHAAQEAALSSQPSALS